MTEKPKRDLVDEAAQIADDEKALHLLAGYAYDSKGQLTTRYPKKGTKEERAGMQAIARVIRRKMKGDLVGEFLALGFDAGAESKTLAPTPSGRLQPTVRITVRRIGRGSTVLRDILAAASMRREINNSAPLVRARDRAHHKSAIHTAKQQHGIGRTRAQNILKNSELMMARGLDPEPDATK